ncbi:MAG: hypothetical protein PHW79_03495 [Candidatus Marinimicrobia bacterium]|jgi:hypothetical protein|nr:hypothetical protein [Candidatus Neomarinimicrobiota bacterium]
MIWLMLITFLLGLEFGYIQIHFRKRELRTRLLFLLLYGVLSAVLLGFFFHHVHIIDGMGFYLIILTTGTAIGVFILLERLIVRFWWFSLALAPVIGIINYLLMLNNTVRTSPVVFLLSFTLCLGHFLIGLYLKYFTGEYL